MTGKLNDYYEGILNAFMIAVDTKNKYSPSHSMRVARTAVKIGKAMNLGERQLENLRIAAILMDIGNIGVQDNIFEKKELLTAEDFIQIQRHPEIGAKIIRNIPDLNGVVPIIMEHHERYDGMGYPGGLKGPDIMTESRVLAIADAYDAMITEHGNRKVLTAQEAINELRENRGKQFDPAITEIFIGILSGEGEA
jgi:HD-GYP domain-containing protein (c-di-GMP phosphodiesterase class II)